MNNDLVAPVDAACGGEPAFYTVEEAALILRIGRTTAYRLANLWLTSCGAEGLEAIMIGGQLRVPRVVLERMAGGPVHLPRHCARSCEAATVTELRRRAG